MQVIRLYWKVKSSTCNECVAIF